MHHCQTGEAQGAYTDPLRWYVQQMGAYREPRDEDGVARNEDPE